MACRPALLRQWRRAAALVLAAALTACAAPERQTLGSPAAHIAQQVGPPQVRVALPDGGERWVYSRQPAGQQAFHLVMDASGHLQRVEQVLQEAHFQRLRAGQDRREDVAQYFGPPALLERVASFKGDIWTYRIRENNVDRQAHVFVDPQGVVQRVMFTDEPRSDRDDRHP